MEVLGARIFENFDGVFMGFTVLGERWRPVVAMLGVNIGLGVMNSLIKKVIDQGTSCLVVITLRQLVATLFMLPIACSRERGQTPELTVRMFAGFFLCGLLGSTLTQYLFFVGIKETTATFSCAFLNMTPALTFVFALIFRMEKLDMREKAGQAKVVGTLVCVGGAMVLTFYQGIALTHARGHKGDDLDGGKLATGEGRWMLGCVALIGASISWCSWFLMQSKVNKIFPALYRCTAIIFFLTFVQAAVWTVASEGGASLLAVRGKLLIFTVLFAGIVGSGIGSLLIMWCITKRGPVFPAAFTPVIQIVVAIIDLIFIHERLHLGSILGSILVVLGLYSLLWGKNREFPSIQEIQVKNVDGREEDGVVKEPA